MSLNAFQGENNVITADSRGIERYSWEFCKFYNVSPTKRSKLLSSSIPK